MAHTTREKKAGRLRAFVEGTAVANRKENLKWKMPPAYAEETRN